MQWYETPDRSRWLSEEDQGRVHYSLTWKGLEMEVMFTAGADCCDMMYRLRHDGDEPSDCSASICVNAGASLGCLDLEGARSFVWFGSGEWIPIRRLPRANDHARWIAGPDAMETPAVLTAVLSRDGRGVFGYGTGDTGRRVRLTNNFCFTCLHITPRFDVAPGEEATVRSRFYCLEGGLDELRERFISDFGMNAGQG